MASTSRSLMSRTACLGRFHQDETQRQRARVLRVIPLFVAPPGSEGCRHSRPPACSTMSRQAKSVSGHGNASDPIRHCWRRRVRASCCPDAPGSACPDRRRECGRPPRRRLPVPFAKVRLLPVVPHSTRNAPSKPPEMVSTTSVLPLSGAASARDELIATRPPAMVGKLGWEPNIWLKMTKPSLAEILMPVEKLVPSALTLKTKSSLPAMPISARPEKADWNTRLAVSVALSRLDIDIAGSLVPPLQKLKFGHKKTRQGAGVTCDIWRPSS